MSIKRHNPSDILSKAVEANGFVFLAGIVAENTSGDVKAQTRDVVGQIDKLLALCGTDKSKIVQAQIWVPDIKLRGEMNVVWKEWNAGKDLPARACVEAKLADPKLLVEIMVTAVK
jgi:enamine deaminase RidA (YjgF/YER057c/UK114 family)